MIFDEKVYNTLVLKSCLKYEDHLLSLVLKKNTGKFIFIGQKRTMPHELIIQMIINIHSLLW